MTYIQTLSSVETIRQLEKDTAPTPTVIEVNPFTEVFAPIVNAVKPHITVSGIIVNSFLLVVLIGLGFANVAANAAFDEATTSTENFTYNSSVVVD